VQCLKSSFYLYSSAKSFTSVYKLFKLSLCCLGLLGCLGLLALAANANAQNSTGKNFSKEALIGRWELTYEPQSQNPQIQVIGGQQTILVTIYPSGSELLANWDWAEIVENIPVNFVDGEAVIEHPSTVIVNGASRASKTRITVIIDGNNWQGTMQLGERLKFPLTGRRVLE